MVGPPYQTAARLVGIAAEHWDAIDGEAASRGVDYFQLGFDRLLNAIYWWAVQRVKEPERFERSLSEHFPLPMEWILAGSAVTVADLDADADSFLAFASAFGIKPPTANPDSAGDTDVPSASSH